MRAEDAQEISSSFLWWNLRCHAFMQKAQTSIDAVLRLLQ